MRNREFCFLSNKKSIFREKIGPSGRIKHIIKFNILYFSKRMNSYLRIPICSLPLLQHKNKTLNQNLVYVAYIFFFKLLIYNVWQLYKNTYISLKNTYLIEKYRCDNHKREL